MVPEGRQYCLRLGDQGTTLTASHVLISNNKHLGFIRIQLERGSQFTTISHNFTSAGDMPHHPTLTHILMMILWYQFQRRLSFYTISSRTTLHCPGTNGYNDALVLAH